MCFFFQTFCFALKFLQVMSHLTAKLYPSPLCLYSGHLQTSKKPGDEPNRRLLLPFHSHTFAHIRQSVHATFASCVPHLEAQENIRNTSDSTFTFSHLSMLSGRGVVSSQRSESVCSRSKHCHVWPHHLLLPSAPNQSRRFVVGKQWGCCRSFC